MNRTSISANYPAIVASALLVAATSLTARAQSTSTTFSSSSTVVSQQLVAAATSNSVASIPAVPIAITPSATANAAFGASGKVGLPDSFDSSPEPADLALVAAGLPILGGLVLRRRRAATVAC